jgi:2-furoate---CoA ligase
MLDLGTSFLASVARDPNALALVDGDVRFTYAEWLNRVSSLVAAFDRIGLKPGDHLLTALQNTWQAATVHWACQLAGLIITPVNWRVTADELDFCVENSESRALIYQDVSEGAVAASGRARDLVMMRAGTGQSSGGEPSIDALCAERADSVHPRASAEAWSVMLYTSGTTSRPKGVPRRHRAERAAGIAHVAQNLYRRGSER